MRTHLNVGLLAAALALGAGCSTMAPLKDIGVGAKPARGAEVIIDGSRAMLDEKWTYWEGPRFASSLPIKWQIVPDPVDGGTCVMTDDRAADGGKYGAADIVTKKPYRDFRHIEFLIMKPGSNSGVYLQNRYEIQVLDSDKTSHGMAAVINETPSPYHAYNGVESGIPTTSISRGSGRPARRATCHDGFNGIRPHQPANQAVWGGANSGLDGGRDGGKASLMCRAD
jgi:hypothetical protein